MGCCGACYGPRPKEAEISTPGRVLRDMSSFGGGCYAEGVWGKGEDGMGREEGLVEIRV